MKAGGSRYNKWVKYPSVKNVVEYFVTRSGGPEYTSKNTIRNIIEAVEDYCRYLGLNNPENVLNMIMNKEIDIVKSVIGWRKTLVLRGVAPSQIHSKDSCLKRWLTVNGVDTGLYWRIIDGKQPKPRNIPRTQDRAPTQDELREILLACNLKMRVLYGLAAVSGVRITALSNLKLDDLYIIEFENGGIVEKTVLDYLADNQGYNDDVIGLIKVRPELNKAKIGYHAFISNEVTKILLKYLRIRLMNEDLSGGVYLFPSKRRDKQHIEYYAIQRYWIDVLKKLGYAKKTGKTHIHELHVHSLRKFFRSQLEGVMTRSEIEVLMGHVKGGYLDGAYLRISLKDMALKYKAAQNKLMIMEKPISTGDKKELLKTMLKAFAPMVGISEMEIEEILHRSKSLDTAVKEIRKRVGLQGFKTNGGGENNIIIVDSDDDLIKYLNQGFEIIRELSDGRVILKR